MKMDDKQLQALAEELNSFSADTLKYFYWTVSKLCTIIELSSDKEGVEYKLQPRNEERDTKNGAPTSEQEAAIMQGLQKKGFFGFQSVWLGADKPIIFGGEHGLTGEAAMRMANDPRSDLEMKYEWGWLENPDLNTLQHYLASIEATLNQTKSNQAKVITPRLTFYPGDGTTEYQTATYKFKGKGRALLSFLNENKNTTFGVEGIKKNCNPNITKEEYHFRTDKDIGDTARYIRTHLEVSKGEFFPIHKRENNWIWVEK